MQFLLWPAYEINRFYKGKKGKTIPVTGRRGP
jgi:hypothetical protein